MRGFAAALTLALTLAAPAQAGDRSARVTAIIDAPGPIPGETVEEMRLHLRKAHPTSTQEQLVSGLVLAAKQSTFDRLSPQPPDVLAPLGPGNLTAALERPWPKTRIVFAAIGEHGAEVVRQKAGGELGAGVLDACSLDGLMLLVRKAMPGARTVGWVKPTEDPLSGASWATLQVSAEAHGFAVDRLDLPAGDLAPFAPFAARHDALLLLYPLADLGLRKVILQAAIEQKKPIFTCDSASVGAGAVAGLAVDAQQVGEALGQLASEAIDQKPPRQIRINTGIVVANPRSACYTGVFLGPELLSRAIVYDKTFVCPTAPPPPSFPWAPLLAGVVGAGLVALVTVGRPRARTG